MSTHFDLSNIALRENYKLDLLTRLGGKVKFYLKVAKFCYKITEHYELAQYFEKYDDMKELHKCLMDILNSAFQELPDAFDVNAHFEQRHKNLIDFGMTSNDFDTFVCVFEATLWDTVDDETLIADAANLLKPLRKVFDTVPQKSNNRIKESSPVATVSRPSALEFVGEPKQEKIQSRRAKLERSKRKQLQKKVSTIIRTRLLLEESSQSARSVRSVSMEEMTVLSADDFSETNW